jgi:hypothetical protein
VPALSSLARLRKQLARPGFDLGGLLFSPIQTPIGKPLAAQFVRAGTRASHPLVRPVASLWLLFQEAFMTMLETELFQFEKQMDEAAALDAAQQHAACRFHRSTCFHVDSSVRRRVPFGPHVTPSRDCIASA